MSPKGNSLRAPIKDLQIKSRLLTTHIGSLPLKNPVICGAGKQIMNSTSIKKALVTGAGSVVAKSTNESVAAKQQLDKTDYALLDIVLERDTDRIEQIVRRIRQAMDLPLWIKLTGKSENFVGFAEAARQGGADSVVMIGRFMGFLPDLETERPLLGTSAAIAEIGPCRRQHAGLC